MEVSTSLTTNKPQRNENASRKSIISMYSIHFHQHVVNACMPSWIIISSNENWETAMLSTHAQYWLWLFLQHLQIIHQCKKTLAFLKTLILPLLMHIYINWWSFCKESKINGFQIYIYIYIYKYIYIYIYSYTSCENIFMNHRTMHLFENSWQFIYLTTSHINRGNSFAS